ncbi:arabinogalactan endo-1,4-beta-galactosidase/uncharacterized protein YjdB [Microbacterium terrae]|uniref:Arabinogalactan endo-beta-1,4-galactanase n=1 Tax=Microbacterium terrae TaxID=69369 RepID=A0A0M2HJG6_9MICO|nr:glycosyl hydrolase 53 family protein [Microbacterium terrae]KJL44503.1 Arabinogalactan endo-1,4-beta-galactosidase precursor [Microbacterium terrae]MBP1079494.1 arabinogalactan endo-1,4-beta-galactosidase/uncharacterized protein YjdB [Microbacterium terrae]GLJ96835.1 hypothetical protein GCM10017594_00320 [Microbacterium terrae]
MTQHELDTTSPPLASIRAARRRTAPVWRSSLALGMAALLAIGVPTAANAVGGSTHVPAGTTVPVDNLSFEQGLSGWTSTGSVTAVGDGHAHDGTQHVRLAAGASVTRTVTGIAQGSYTLAGWFDGAKSNNAAALTATDTGAPSATAPVDVYLAGAGTWAQGAHRNVLVYNGQVTITITAGSSPLLVDGLTLTLDSQDVNPLQNWGFDDGLSGWAVNDAARVTGVTDGADSGSGAVRLGAGGAISQTIPVEPDTRYVVTARARVEREDTYTSTTQTDRFGPIGTLVTRSTTGNRVNIGVKGADDVVLRQAPAATAGYSLVSVSFTTDADDEEVTVYANTIADEAYRESVGVFADGDGATASGAAPADDWTGNGSDGAWIDNFDVFALEEGYIRGADVSNLQVLEDNGAKYFANGVQQDALRILSNRGVNSITGMIFVHAGKTLYDDSLQPIKVTDAIPGGGAYPDTLKLSHEGYFDEVHTVALAERAADLDLSLMPSYHLSDGFVSASKASTPYEWLDHSYDGTVANSDLAHIRSATYNYVRDSLTAIADTGVDIIAVKQGNEQNGGLVWPIGKGATSAGHAALIAAVNDAVQEVAPGAPGWAHTNNGYSTSAAQSFFTGLMNNGAKIDGASFSLYGGRSSANILNMAEMLNADPALRHLDYVNVEAAVSFTSYKATWASDNVITPPSQYYSRSVNGQYNWLLDYMQAPLDVPNPYGQMRGFYFWEIDWIPVGGIGSKQGVPADVSTRTMFNNGNPAITQMGSTQPGKTGDMLDSLSAYLMRGTVKDKPVDMQSPLDDPTTREAYAVESTAPTGITLAGDAVELTVGSRERLQPTVAPVDRVLTESTISYTSADETVATVSPSGYVVGTGPGTTTVTAAVSGNLTASIPVVVTAPGTADAGDLIVRRGATELTDGATITVAALEKLQLSTTLADGATDRKVVFTSSDPDVATFLGETWQTPQGELRAYSGSGNTVQLNILDEGTTDLTVSTSDGGSSVTVHVVAAKVAVTAVTLAKPNAHVAIGTTVSLGGAVTPSNATLNKLVWTSADPSVATVDDSGTVRGVENGVTTVTAVSHDNPSASATATITVAGVRATDLAVFPADVHLAAGATRTIGATVTPADVADATLTWTSADPAVATVDAGGKVTAVGAGEADITARTTDGSDLTAVSHVTVHENAIEATALTLEPATHWFQSDHFANPSVGDAPERALSLTVEPADATNADIVWTSNTPQVATVDPAGTVTAVAPGVAEISARTRDGSLTSTTTVHVPQLSETFENRGSTFTWGQTAVSGVPAMTSRVTTGAGGMALVYTSRSGTGPSALQKVFAEPIVNDTVVADLTYNVGTPGSSNGAYLAIADSAGNRYVTLQFIRGTELAIGSGGALTGANAASLVPGMTPVGTGLNVNAAWYAVHAELDLAARQATVTVTSRANNAITATRTIPFDDATEYTGDVAAVQLWTAGSGSGVWYPAVAEAHFYGTSATAREVVVDPTEVRLVPVTGTLGVSEQVTASVLPATAPQDLTWTSSAPEIVAVDDDGLVSAVTTYADLGAVVPATADITVAATSDPSVKKTVRVTITDTPNASEQLTVIDESGDTVSPADDPIALDDGEQLTLIATPTGGDGPSDIANIEWTSTDDGVVALESVGGREAAIRAIAGGRGTATITVRVWTFGADTPLTARITVDVDGGAPQDATEPEVTGLPTGDVNAIDGLDVSITATDPESGIRSLVVTLAGDEITANGHVDISGLSGEQTVTATASNNAGLETTATSTIFVVPVDGATKAPSTGVLSNTSGWAHGLHDGSYDVVMNLWWGTPGSVFRLYENSELVATKVLGAAVGTSQTLTTRFTGKPNGTYVYTSELINSKGTTTTTSTTVVVDAAAPGVPAVSHDNWDGDGDFTATANMWWGTNATSYTFTLDGQVVAEGTLAANSPNRQTASAHFTGVSPGVHTIQAVFTNPSGSTSSQPLQMTVRG